MKRLAIYRETPLNSNYRPLFYLAEQKETDILIFDHKGVKWTGVKLWHSSRVFRFLLRTWIENSPDQRANGWGVSLLRKLVEKAPFQKAPSWADLLKSVLFPIRLLFMKNIVVAFTPYSIMGYYLLLLKLMRKNVVFFTSWPFWNGEDYVYRPRLGSRNIWETFLNGVKAVSVTRKSANELEELGANARFIPHSVDIHLFTPKRKKEKNKTTLLYVGRVVKEKGVIELCRVFGLLREKYPQLELSIVGDGPEIGKISGRKGISCKGYLGNVTDLVAEYQSSDIFVLNSYRIDGWQELFGIALIEAMACGLPCVATDCVGPREIVKDGLSGFLIAPRDESELYRKLERLIRDRDLRTQFGKIGRDRATLFAVESNAKKWLKAISE